MFNGIHRIRFTSLKSKRTRIILTLYFPFDFANPSFSKFRANSFPVPYSQT